jgi:hypothetical protein
VKAEAPDAGPAAEPLDDKGAFVLHIAGEVQIRRGGQGEWMALQVGDMLRVGDHIRTSGDGQVGLSFDATRIRVHEDSEVTLDAIDPTAVRISVAGTGEAELPGGKGKVSFAAGGAVASTEAGRMTLAFDGKDVIASALSGDATLTQGGKTVTLKAGEFVLSKNQGPSKPAKIPKAITLEVAWPEETETNQALFDVRGKVSAYARVFVAGKRVEPEAGGAFSAKVPLKRGKQNVVITAIDPFGRRAVRSRSIVMDPDAPSIKGAVEYR